MSEPGLGGAGPVNTVQLTDALFRYLPLQRWFSGHRHALTDVSLADVELLNTEWPMLLWAMADARTADGVVTRYQLLIGLRPLDGAEFHEFLDGVPTAVLGEVHTEHGPAIAYNALHDPELAMVILARLAPDESAGYVRQIGAEVSSSVLVYDERLLLRIFRRLRDGPNPDVATVRALASVGFEHVAAPIAGWRRGDVDLAVLRQFIAGGAEGWQLALTSLRDAYDRRGEPAGAGGDFGPEARRLGQVSGALHLALADAFGDGAAAPDAWGRRMRDRLANPQVQHPDLDGEAALRLVQRMEQVGAGGRAIRVHGDHQLRRVMRTDQGWFVLGFEGERPRSEESAARVSSPLEDVATMLRSLHYATQLALAERADEVDDELVGIGEEWERRASGMFLSGYLGVDGIERLQPSAEDRDLVLDAFLLDRGVVELAAELASRPSMVHVPLTALGRLLARY